MLFGSAFINLISSWQSSLVVSIKNAEDISFLVIFNCGLGEVTNILLGTMYIDNLNQILSRILIRCNPGISINLCIKSLNIIINREINNIVFFYFNLRLSYKSLKPLLLFKRCFILSRGQDNYRDLKLYQYTQFKTALLEIAVHSVRL